MRLLGLEKPRSGGWSAWIRRRPSETPAARERSRAERHQVGCEGLSSKPLAKDGAPGLVQLHSGFSGVELPTTERHRVLDWLLGLGNPAVSVAVALGLVGCATGPKGSTSGRLPDPKTPRLSQLDYPTETLGNGRFTIGSSGCLLTSLTMASCVLHERRDLDPVKANARVLAQGGFSGSALELDIAAPALGLRVTHREAVHASSRSRLNDLLDAELGAGRPVVVGVDLHPGQSSSAESGADHFILIYGQRDGRYLVVDPAGGGLHRLQQGEDGVIHYESDAARTVSELITLQKASFGA